MAFIPTRPTTGTRVKLKRDIPTIRGTFQAGTEMTITGEGHRGYDLVDDEGNNLCETGLLGDFFTKVQ